MIEKSCFLPDDMNAVSKEALGSEEEEPGSAWEPHRKAGVGGLEEAQCNGAEGQGTDYEEGTICLRRKREKVASSGV